jgi:hypothetical protein
MDLRPNFLVRNILAVFAKPRVEPIACWVKLHHSLKSPLCSCVSTTFSAFCELLSKDIKRDDDAFRRVNSKRGKESVSGLPGPKPRCALRVHPHFTLGLCHRGRGQGRSLPVTLRIRFTKCAYAFTQIDRRLNGRIFGQMDPFTDGPRLRS